MSNGVGSPKEDIKKYDIDFLKPKQASPINIDISNEKISDSTSLFGVGYTESEKIAEQNYLDELSRKAPIDYDMNLLEKGARSFVAGIGDLLTGVGDAVDFISGTPNQDAVAASSELSKSIYGVDTTKSVSSYFSEAFHTAGKELQSVGDPVAELGDVENITWNDMFDVDFWFTHAARAIPFTLSFFVPGAAGARGAQVAYRGLSALNKGKSIGRAMQKAGLVRHMHQGSKLAQGATSFAGGAALGNMSEGAIIAGQVYNDAIKQGMTEKQASVAAHDTFVDNMKWMAVDGLQLGFITGGNRFLKTMLPKKAQQALSLNFTKAPSIKSVVSNMAKVSGIVLTDGMLEQFQESYQDWASKTNLAEQRGEEFMSYMDFFTSKENLPTRVIAFASSMAVSGAKTAIDVSAERKRLFSLEKGFDEDFLFQEVEEFELSERELGKDARATSGKSVQELKALKLRQLDKLLVKRVLEGKGDYYVDLVNHLLEENQITQSQHDSFVETAKQMESLVESTPSIGLNEKEKARVILATRQKNKNNAIIENQLQALNQEKEKIEQQDLDEDVKAEMIAGIDEAIAEVESGNITLLDEEGNPLLDDNGNEKVARQENAVHEQAIKSVYAEATARRERERADKTVRPKIAEIIEKQNAGQQITEEEQSFIDNRANNPYYNEMLRADKLQKAQDAAGLDFELDVEQTNIDEGSYVFKKKEGDKVTTKTVDSNYNVEEKVVTNETISKDSTTQAQEESKSSTDNRDVEKEVDKDVTEKDDNISSDESVIDDLDTESKKARQENNMAIAEERLSNKLYGGQLEAWADEQMASEPTTAIFFDESLIDNVGKPAIGMAIGLAQYINPLTFTQEVFHHENWHIYQTMYQNTREMKALLKEIVKQPVFEQTKLQEYTELDVIYKGKKLKFNDLIGSKKTGVISIKEWMAENNIQGDVASDANVRRYLFDMETIMGSQGFTILPDSQQEQIKNEALAKAAGLQNTIDTPFWNTTAKKRNSKARRLLTDAWSRIRKGSKNETSKKILSSHFPDLYSNNYAEMLNSFRAAVNAKENPISWNTYTRSKGMFLTDKSAREMHQRTSADFSIDLAIVQSNIIEQEAQKIATAFEAGENLSDIASRSASIFEAKKQDILLEVKKLAKLNNLENVEAIESRFQKRAKRIDSLIVDEIRRNITNKIAVDELGQLDLFGSNEMEVAFGDFLNDEFKRGVSNKVSQLLTGFTELYNKNKNKEDSVITKSKVETVIAEYLDGNRNNYENFELSVNLAINNVNNSEQSTSNEKIIKEFVSYVNGKLKSPGVDLNSAINNIWQYFKSFRHEKVFQFNIDSDNNILVSESLPKYVNVKVNSAIQIQRESMIKNPGLTMQIAIALDATKNSARKKAAILSILNSLVPPRILLQDSNFTFTEEDLDSMKVAGMPIMEYFSNERVDFLINELIAIDWKSHLSNSADYYKKQKVELEKENKLIKEDINAILATTPLGERHQATAIIARDELAMGNKITPDEQISFDKYLAAFNILKNSYDFYVENPNARTEFKTNFFVSKSFPGGVVKRNIEKSKINSIFLGSVEESFIKDIVQAGIFSKNNRTLLGQVRNPENESIGTFNKTSNLYNNIETLESLFKSMNLDLANKYPNRMLQLFRYNPYAYGMFESVYNQTALDNHNIKERASMWSPDIGYMSGYYDDTVKKGFKSSRMNPTRIKQVRFMHIVDSLKKGAKQYKHFIGVFGDSQRQYFMNNAIIHKPKRLQTLIEEVQKNSNDNLNIESKANELFNELKDAGFVTDGDKNTVIEAYKQNYVNKYYIQDLYFNKAASMTDSKMMADLPKRLKGITSPMAPMSGTRILPIIIKDDKLKTSLQELNIADSESFILPEHQKLIALQYGELNEVGNNLKSLYYGQNLDNIAFEKKIGRPRVPLYFKTSTKVLEEEFSQKSEVFRALREVLSETARRHKDEAVIPIIYFDSSIKGGLTSSELESVTHSMQDIINASNDIYFLNNQKTENLDNAYELLVNDGKLPGLQKFIKKQNSSYQFKNDAGVVSTGFDGANFGIQTKLDNANPTGILAKQMLSNLNVFNTIESISSGANQGKSGYEALAPIKRILSEILELQYAENFANKNFEQKFNERQEQLKSFIESQLIEQLGINFAGNEQKFNDVVGSLFKSQVAKMQTNGTFSVEMSDIGYNLSIDGDNVSYNETLKSYTIENGNVSYGEVVMPFIAKQRGLNIGDKVLVSRIPHSKPGDGIVMVVKEFNSSKAGNTIIIPTEHASLIGSDKDGDGLHVNMKVLGDELTPIQAKKNEFLDALFDLYTSPEVYKIIMQPVDFTQTIRDEGLNYIQETLAGDKKSEFTRVKSDLHVNDEFAIQDRFLGNFIGIAASMNRTVNYFASSGLQNDLATEVRVSSKGKSVPLKLKILDKNGKLYEINKLTNKQGNNENWLTYAQYLNFIIDDGKAGDRAKFNITKDSASHFSYLLRTGMPVKSVLDLMYNPKYVSYIENRAKGLSKRESVATAFNINENNVPTSNFNSASTVDLGGSIKVDSFVQLINSLDLITSDLQTISEMVNLDSSMPKNMIELVSLEKRFEDVMSRQNSIKQKFELDPYLKTHQTLLSRYKQKLNETSTVSAREAEVLIGLIENVVDLNNETASELINNAISLFKLSSELKPNFDGKSFHNLYLDLLNTEFSELTEIPYSNFQKMQDDFTRDNLGMSQEEFAIYRVHEIADKIIKDINSEGTNKFLNALESSKRKLTKKIGNRTVTHTTNRYVMPFEVQDNILSQEDLKTYKDAFMELPKELRNFFIGYEYFVNKLGIGKNNTLMGFFPKQVISEVKRASNKVKANTQVETAPGVFNRDFTIIKTLLSRVGKSNLLSGQENYINEQQEGLESSFDESMSLIELMIAFDPVAFRGILSDTPLYKQDLSFIDETSEVLTSKIDKGSGVTGQMVFTNNVYLGSYKGEEKGIQVEKDKDGPIVSRTREVIANRDWTELNILNMYGQSLDSEFTVQKSKASGRMFLKSKSRPTIYGTEVQYTAEEYAKNFGFLKTGDSIEDLADFEPAQFEKLKTDYAKYLNDYIKVEGSPKTENEKAQIGIKQRFINDSRLQIPKNPEEITGDFYIEASRAIEEYQVALQGITPQAKAKMSELLHYRYGEIIAMQQNQRWRNVVSPDGERVGEYLLNQVNQEDYDKDISLAAMVLSPGDFGQYNPTLAGVRRNLEIANSRMHRDLKLVQDELNNAYNALYKEKYGMLKPLAKAVSNIPIFRYFHPIERVAENLFKNLQTQKTSLIAVIEKGSKNRKYKPVYQTELSRNIFNADNTLRADAKKKLSKAEYNYAKIVSRYTIFYNNLLKEVKGPSFRDRDYYRPLTTASRFEILRRRGIYGLYKKSLSKDNLYHNIFIKAYDPFSTKPDKMEVRTYGEFKALYSISKEEAQEYAKNNPLIDTSGARPVMIPLNYDKEFFTQTSRIKALRKAKNTAQKHMLSMRDELGNPVRPQDEVSSVVSAENETFNRFTSRRSENAAYFASNNLHHAMFEYLKTMVFQYGTAYKGSGNAMFRIRFQVASDDLYGKKTKVSNVTATDANTFRQLERLGKARNFMGFENKKFLVDAAMTYLYHNGGKTNSIKYLQDVVMDKFIRRQPKKLITGLEAERKIVDTLTRWTMVVGLGLNFSAAAANIIIGKYNAYRSQGFQGFVKAHTRVFGIDKSGRWDRKAATKAQKMLEEFGILTYRPQDQLEDASYNTILDKIIFFPMVTAEKFIQRAQFMGELSDEQWNSYDLDEDGNLIVVDRENALDAQTIAKYARRVQNVQGRGYSEVDQRLIQTYAFGSMLLQFKRWFPTYLVDRFGKAGYGSYIDDFGNVYRGSTQATLKNLQLYANPLKYKENKGKLDKATRDAIERYHRGMLVPLIIGLALVASGDDEDMDDRLKSMYIDLERHVGDMLLVANAPAMFHTLTVPGIATAQNMYGLLTSIVGYMAGLDSAVYTRDAKYGQKGEPKAKRYAASLMPSIAIPKAEFNLRESIFGRSVKRRKRKTRKTRRRR